MATTYVLEPLSTEAATAIRAGGGMRYVADSKPGFPCRACLRDAEIGEELLLVSHDPFDADSPYRSAGPIFIHSEPCAHAVDLDRPDQLTVRQLAVRAFDGKAMMIDAAVIDGEDLDDQIAEMFSNVDADHLHVHFAQRGCWAVRVIRNPEAALAS